MADKKVIQTLITELSADGAKFKKESDKSLNDAKVWAERIKKLTSGIVLGGVGLSLGGVFSRFISETKSAENEQAQLAAVLKSTGNAAGFTQAQLNDMADGLESITSISGGDFTQAQTSLLAFTGIAGEELPRALKAAADMSARTGIDIKQAAETIGRALDVPSQGMAALSKQGFRFSEDQKKVIKQLEDTGRTSEAQGIILEALEQTYGGAAVAARDTFGGALASLNNTVSGLLTGDGSLIAAKDAVDQLNKSLSSQASKDGISYLISGMTNLTEGGVNIASELGGLGDQIALSAANLSGNLSEFDKVSAEIRVIERAIKGGLSTPIKYAFTSDAELKALLDEKKAVLDTLSGITSAGTKEIKPIENAAKTLFSEYNNSSIDDEINNQLELRVKEQKKIYAQAEKLADQVDGQADSYRRQISLSTDAAESQKLQYEIAYGSLKGINSEQEKLLSGLAAEVDSRNKIIGSEAAHKELMSVINQAHEENLQIAGKVVDLESYRYERQKNEQKQYLEDLRSRGLATAEIEADAQKLIEEQEAAHQGRLAEIKKKADEEEIQRRQVQLAGAEQLFGSLGDLTEAFGDRASKARKALFIGEKVASIARATMAISTGIAEAAANPFPMNIGAMASVAAATAGIISDIQSVNIAHGGLDYVPKETTYLLDKGERVISPKQNKDLTNYLSNAQPGGGSPNVQIINQTGVAANAETNMLSDGTMQIILRAVDSKLQNDLGNGRGVWANAAKRYGWSTKGAF